MHVVISAASSITAKIRLMRDKRGVEVGYAAKPTDLRALYQGLQEWG